MLGDRVVIEDYRENPNNFIFAFVNLVFPHLFFVFHATRNKVKDYLVEVKCGIACVLLTGQVQFGLDLPGD